MPRVRVEVEPGAVRVFQRQVTPQRPRPANITPHSQQCQLVRERNANTRFPPAALLDLRHERVGRHAEPRLPTQSWVSNGSTVCFDFKAILI